MSSLPPLPEAYLEAMSEDCPLPPPGVEPPTHRRLRDAFGPDCVEVNYPIKIDVRSRAGAALFATQHGLLPEEQFRPIAPVA